MSRKGYKSIGTPRDVAKRGVSLQFGKIYLPKGVFSVKSIGTYCKRSILSSVSIQLGEIIGTFYVFLGTFAQFLLGNDHQNWA